MKKYVKNYIIINEEDKLITNASYLTDDCSIVGEEDGRCWRVKKGVLCYYNPYNRLNLKPIENLILDDRSTDGETVIYFKDKDFNEIERFLRKNYLGFKYR